MRSPGRPPAGVVIAAALSALWALGLAALGLLSLTGSGRVGTGVAVVLLLWSAVVGLGAWGMVRLRRWARGPVVAAALLHLAAFAGFVPSQPWAAAAVLAAAAILVAALWPSTTRALHLDAQDAPDPD